MQQICSISSAMKTIQLNIVNEIQKQVCILNLKGRVVLNCNSALAAPNDGLAICAGIFT